MILPSVLGAPLLLSWMTLFELTKLGRVTTRLLERVDASGTHSKYLGALVPQSRVCLVFKKLDYIKRAHDP